MPAIRPAVRRPATWAAAALALAVLAGCTPTVAEPEPSPSVDSILNPELQPIHTESLTEDYARTEALRLAEEMTATLGTTSVLSVEDESQLIPVDDDIAAYYAFSRIVTLDPAVDAITAAELLVAVLHQSGWTLFETTNEDGIYVAALSAGPDHAQWFALVSGDASVEGATTVSFQLASPDIR